MSDNNKEEWKFLETKDSIVITKMDEATTRQAIEQNAKNENDIKSLKNQLNGIEHTLQEVELQKKIDDQVETMSDTELKDVFHEYAGTPKVQMQHEPSKKAELSEKERLALEYEGIDPEQVTQELLKSWQKVGI